ncbi:cell division protein [Paenibacillus sp. FSL H8-0548]|uniref:cell division protein FtsX n=1 Tax=Paenibacillus sp. FSL H8-0548 TaxID=1920422 RepID=UPI00096D3065|nr:permease-like cell division protein FtsX [Paenibacillus sp. FSL H8-0548]OMF37590.1 cell division protein [Paenibacillus sp. FSL H8-0548]
MSLFKYYLRDAREGITRNLGAVLAAAALVFIAMIMLGSMLLLRAGVADVMKYMESQIGVKVYVDPAVDVQAVAKIMESKSFVKSVEVETSAQLLASLNSFFEGKEHLLQTFIDSDLPHAIRLELADYNLVEQTAKDLRLIPGIAEVIYPQKLATQFMYWSNQLNRFGMVILLFFVVIAFLTVFLAVRLALFQRFKEIRVKLLLGAKPTHVSGQFMFEGLLIGFIGSTAAAIAVYILSKYVFDALERQFPFLFDFTPAMLNGVMVWVVLSGSIIALLASYLSIRRTIKYV